MARPEVTGKKIVAINETIDLDTVVKEFCQQHVDLDSYSIEEFCRRHGISIPFYYKLRAQGLGPREMEKGARVLITKESAADWRREGVAETAAKRAEQRREADQQQTHVEENANS
jgi:hypothetical protein